MPLFSGGAGGVSGFPVNTLMIGEIQSGGHSATINALNWIGFMVYAPVLFSRITVLVAAADAVNNSDLGIYKADGSALLANIGAQHIAGTALQTFNTVQAAQTLTPGRYIFAYTSVAATFSLGFDQSWPTWGGTYGGTGSSSGGALPASFTPGAAALFNLPSLVVGLS